MIAVRNLHKKFGKNQVLKGVDLNLDTPGIFAILGPNGSGKTTLIKAILGMVLPNKGEIIFQEKSIKKEWKYRKSINYLPQIANFPGNLRLRELLTMIKDIRGLQTPSEERLIQLFALKPFLNKKLSHLSGGTRQKVNLVLAFMNESPVFILDEPTTGLDPVSLVHLKELIMEEKEKGKTILISSHIMSFVNEVADEVVFLLEGKIYFQGSVQALKEMTHETDFEKAIAKVLSQENA
ncbi:MAG: ABC transporter ATP-binding protein [Flavobacteriaceae bacterium]|nr:ABC transporter ATP-binding protein [Flavobacteriaceae bacterium]